GGDVEAALLHQVDFDDVTDSFVDPERVVNAPREGRADGRPPQSERIDAERDLLASTNIRRHAAEALRELRKQEDRRRDEGRRLGTPPPMETDSLGQRGWE